MNKDNLKMLAAAFAGIAGGLALGHLLWSPEKEETRKSLLKKIDDLKDNFDKAKETGETSLETLKDMAANLMKEIEDKLAEKPNNANDKSHS